MKLIDQAKRALDVQKDKSVSSWLWALGIRETCGRCAGTGRYSWNRQDGDRCFGCGGRGEKTAKLTRKTYALLVAAIDSGRVEEIKIANRARRAARARLAPLAAKALEAYKLTGDRYTAFGKGRAAAEVVASEIFRLQGEANACYYGIQAGTRVAVSRIVDDVERGRRTDFEVYEAQLFGLHLRLAELGATPAAA